MHFTGRLKATTLRAAGTDRPQLSLELEEPSLGSSNRFFRRFGSHRFLQITLHNFKSDFRDAAASSALNDYLKRPVVIAGSVFRTFFRKDHHVFLLKTDETVEFSVDGCHIRIPKEPSGLPESDLLSFISWHNDLEVNSNQVRAKILRHIDTEQFNKGMGKWVSRFSLGLSNSVPGIRILPEDMSFVTDESAWPCLPIDILMVTELCQSPDLHPKGALNRLLTSS